MTKKAMQSLDKLDKLGYEGVIADLKARGGTEEEVAGLELYLWCCGLGPRSNKEWCKDLTFSQRAGVVLALKGDNELIEKVRG